jgi:calcineurin-like phosphoesterase family protein
MIMSNINPNDNLWILGDVCFCKESFVKHVLPIANKVNLSTILGNHDGERRYAPTILDYINAGINVYGLAKYKTTNDSFILSHCPVHPAELRGNLNLHGHVHLETINDQRYINCCCEVVDFIPKTINELLKMRVL